MKAIIMAGGDGSRLRPVTCTQPKPMVRILNVPVMEYAIRLLRSHGIREIGVTLRYLPDAIRDYFGDGTRFGVSLTYFTELTPLGTAGGVKQAAGFLNEPFIVLSGDGITDCDLSAAIRFHESHGAEATLVSVHHADPREFGVICADDDGRITCFQEKPDWGEVFGSRINTGIYVLNPSILGRIPDGQPFDFAKDLFPAMLSEGVPLYAWDADCYWCDIGDTQALISANMDALNGKIRLIPMPSDGILRHPTARIEDGAVIHAPVCIGEGAYIASGAEIGPGACIGADCRIDSDASVHRSVIDDGVRIGADAVLRDCLILEGVRVHSGAMIGENAVVGAESTVGRGAELMPNIRVWPEKHIPDHMCVRENVRWGQAAQAAFHMGSVDCFTPTQAVACVQALCEAMNPHIVLIAHSASAVAAAQHRAVLSGLMAQGVQVYDCRAAALPELRCMLNAIGGDCACYVTPDAFYPLTASGVSLTGSVRRQFIHALNRGTSAAPYSGITHMAQSAGRCDLIYLNSVAGETVAAALRGFRPPVAVYARFEQLLSLAERAFLRAGLTVRAEWEEEMMELAPGEIGVWLSDTGESMRLFTKDGELTETEMQLMVAQALLESGEKRLILPAEYTASAEALADRYRARVERVSGASEWAEQTAFLAPKQLPIHFDGIRAALCCLAMLHRLGMSIDDFRRSVPAAVRRRKVIDIPQEQRARLLEQLNRDLHPDRPGRFHMKKDDAHAWILPAEDDCRCTILAEAADTETARELCDFYEAMVRKAVRGRD